MGVNEISQLLPLGGASVLLIYLLRMLMAERATWSRERKSMIAEHEHDLEKSTVDLIKMLDRLRARVADLEAEVDRLRAELRKERS